MKVSIYKWSQYYLMYSPIWRKLTFDKNKIINQINSDCKFNTRLSLAYKILFKQKQCFLSQVNKKDKMVEQYMQRRNKIQALNTKPSQECQVSVQYWLKQKQRIRNKIDDILVVVKNKKYNQIEEQNNTKQTLNINQNNNNNKNKNNNESIRKILSIDEMIQQLLDQFKPKSEQININIKKAYQDNKNNQSDIKLQTISNSTQRVYQIDQLSKRILINQLVSLLQKHNQKEQQSQFTLQIDEVVSIQLIMKVLDMLLSRQLVGLEEQLYYDWLCVILKQQQIIYLLKESISQLTQYIILNNQDKEQQQTIINFKNITIIFKLYDNYQKLQKQLKNVLDNSQNKQSQLMEQYYHQLQKLQNLSSTQLNSNNKHKINNKYQTLNNKNKYQTITNNRQSKEQTIYRLCLKQVKKVYLIQQLIQQYINLIKGQSKKQLFTQIYQQIQTLINITNTNTNTNNIDRELGNTKNTQLNKLNNYNKSIIKGSNNNKQLQQHRLDTNIKYQLWKLTQLINIKPKLIQFINKYSVGINIKQINTQLIQLINQQISTTIHNISIKMNNNQRNNKNKTKSIQIEDVLYIGAIVNHLNKLEEDKSVYSELASNNNNSNNNNSNSNNSSNNLCKLLYKISEQCNRRILNYDIQTQATTKSLTVSTQCIRLLQTILNNYNQYQKYLHLIRDNPKEQKQQYLHLILDNKKEQKQQQPNLKQPLQIQFNNHINVLIYMNQTQLLAKLIKTLQTSLITNKQYIILSKSQKQQLLNIITTLIKLNTNTNTNTNNNLLSQQSFNSINKILSKIT